MLAFFDKQIDCLETEPVIFFYYFEMHAYKLPTLMVYILLCISIEKQINAVNSFVARVDIIGSASKLSIHSTVTNASRCFLAYVLDICCGLFQWNQEVVTV